MSVGCNNFDVVGLEEDIDLFVDDEGALNGSRLNLRTSINAQLAVKRGQGQFSCLFQMGDGQSSIAGSHWPPSQQKSNGAAKSVS